jgi:hypothetical protein
MDGDHIRLFVFTNSLHHSGTDLPNTASLAVMRRLGIGFHKNVQYPLGAGVEYVLHRDDAGPLPKPVLILLGQQQSS